MRQRVSRAMIASVYVSDDECPRYRFSVLLGSTSLVQTSFSPLRCMFCFSERMLSVIPFFLLFALSLSLYVLDDAVHSSSYSFPHFLVLGHSPFPSSRLHTLSVESLSPSADRDSFILRESSHFGAVTGFAIVCNTPTTSRTFFYVFDRLLS